MILGDLFESRMSDLDIQYQDYKKLEPVAFYSRYKMTKDEWASKHWSLIKGRETIHEETDQLSVGDPVVIQGTEYDGKTGDIKEFSPSGKFVVVDLYNYGPQAFHLANVEYNQYADELDEGKTTITPTGLKHRATDRYGADYNQSGIEFSKQKDHSDLKKVDKTLTKNLEKGMDVHFKEGLRDPKDNPCWTGYKPVGTKKKAGKTVPNCVPVEEEQLDELKFLGSECTKDCSGHRAGYNWSKRRGGVDGMSPWSPSFNKGAALAKAGK